MSTALPLLRIRPAPNTPVQEKDEAATMPGFFHFLTLLGLHIFAHESVDVVVLEVGLGGRLDATNVVPRPVASGITTLDYDHVAILGPTLADIAREKAGIMRAGVPVYTIPQEATAAAALQAAAAHMHTPLATVDTQWLDSRLQATPSPPHSIAGGAAYQRLNASLAVALAEEFARQVPPGLGLGGQAHNAASHARHTATVSAPDAPIAAALCQGLAASRWPGRAHTVLAAVPGSQGAAQGVGLQVCLDGAHTAAAMLKAAEWYQQERSAAAEHSILMFNCNHGKDPLPLLAPLIQMSWDGVLFAPFDFDKPTSAEVPSVLEVFENHAKLQVEAGTMSDADARQLVQSCQDAVRDTLVALAHSDGAESWPEPPLSQAAAAAVHSGSGSSSGALKDAAAAAVAAAQGSAPQYDLRWQRVLAQVWAVLIRHPSLTEKILKPCAAGTEAQMQAAEAAAAANAAPIGATDAVVCNSIKDALACMGAMAAAAPPSTPSSTAAAGGISWEPKLGAVAVDVNAPALPSLAVAPTVRASALVSGSLYLVGNSLQHLGWSPDKDVP